MADNSLDIASLRAKNIHIVGVSGAEGCAILRFLWAQGCKKLTVHDFSTQETFDKSFRLFHLTLPAQERFALLQEMKSLPIPFHYQDTYLQNIDTADLIFASQGWIKHEANFPFLKDAKDKGVPFATLTQLYFTYTPCPIIAVTGSNGKSSTTALIYSILNHAGKTALMAGNARESAQVLDTLATMPQGGFLVLETSDRQLIADIPKSPHIAVLTTLSPNHLDDHGTYEQYIKTKQRLFTKQTVEDFAVLPNDIPEYSSFVASTPAKKYTYGEESFTPEGIVLEEGFLIPFNEIPLVGHHNYRNVAAAATACLVAGCSIEEIRNGIKTFAGLPHRTQPVGVYNSITYIDDIQSTTPESTIAALEACKKPLVLIAGGDDKGMEYEKCIASIVKNTKAVVLVPGTATIRLVTLLAEKHPHYYCETFFEALTQAQSLATSGDTILISPAAAHFQTKYLEGKSVKTWVAEKHTE